MTRVVGLTGGIATGKTTVGRLLASLGAVVIDADALTREVQSPGSLAVEDIAEAFGAGVVGRDGALDREALGAIVFRDPEARARLNAIVHPRVGALMARRLEEARAAGAELVVLDIPLLFETGMHGMAARERLGLEAVILVYAPAETQVQRQLERNGYDRAEAERRIRAQMPIDDKRGLAEIVIDNSGSRAETEHQVRALYEKLTGVEAPA